MALHRTVASKNKSNLPEGPKTYVGMDVSRERIHVTILSEEGKRTYFQCENDEARIASRLRAECETKNMIAAYEGGAGYGLCRALERQGIRCFVIKPLPPQLSKTDEVDSARIAGALMAGKCTPLWVPGPAIEHTRRLLNERRCRVTERRRAFQQSEDLTRTILRCEGIVEAEAHALADEVRSLSADLKTRVENLDDLVKLRCADPELAPRIRGLMAFRGIAELTALEIISIIGDCRRFPTSANLASYAGLATATHASGRRHSRFKADNHRNNPLRHCFLQAGRHYRALSETDIGRVSKRRGMLSPDEYELVTRAERDVSARWTRMLAAGKHELIAQEATARVLSVYVWEFLTNIENRLTH